MSTTRRPTAAQIRNAASVLARALDHEAQRIRAEQGNAGHVAAQELEHDAMRVSSLGAPPRSDAPAMSVAAPACATCGHPEDDHFVGWHGLEEWGWDESGEEHMLQPCQAEGCECSDYVEGDE